MPMLFWLRAETKEFEHRTILTPEGARALIASGHKVRVEECSERCFPTSAYADAGAEICPAGSWASDDAEAGPAVVILGLKELPDDTPTKLRHTHIMYGHCYKSQIGARELLSRFHAGGGRLLDLEFCIDDAGQRVAVMGPAAGYCGMAIALHVWAARQQQKQQGDGGTSKVDELSFVKPFDTYATLAKATRTALDAVTTAAGSPTEPPRVTIIGALGRCGGGARRCLRECGVPDASVTEWDMAETKVGGPFPALATDADIVANCVFLPAGVVVKPFLTNELLERADCRLGVVLDVSCDTSSDTNPLPMCDRSTSFAKPSRRVVGDVDTVSIDHLPALVPSEASRVYADGLLPHLLALGEAAPGGGLPSLWRRTADMYDEHVAAAGL
eukprot:TRINITY_DN1737_c2_g1_i1.p1 TRINITY_DN1737_c2_g1~~TRINITY_DN1737_c2_g1_i1.p1  ORF type:complete len:399 (+),score=102.75 TRINITY_DN1737_c2_g1_i1:37-1197(+)